MQQQQQHAACSDAGTIASSRRCFDGEGSLDDSGTIFSPITISIVVRKGIAALSALEIISKMTVSAGIAFSILHLALLRGGVNAFLVVPLPSTSSFSSSALASTSSPNDPYATLIDAISHAADAAYSAAQHSEQLASSIGGDMLLATSASLSPSAQAGLSILEKNIATSSDPTVLMQAIHAALDSSIHAAEMAASSTTVLVHNLANFDEALATSMALASNNPNFHTIMLSPEYSNVAQAKLALLLHNLSGLTIDDNFLSNFLSEMDKQLDALLPSSSASGAISVSTSNMILYGTVAAVLAYSQRQAGIEGYKMELRTLLERGELDMTMVSSILQCRVVVITRWGIFF
jgi:hypothetical protein